MPYAAACDIGSGIILRALRDIHGRSFIEVIDHRILIGRIELRRKLGINGIEIVKESVSHEFLEEAVNSVDASAVLPSGDRHVSVFHGYGKGFVAVRAALILNESDRASRCAIVDLGVDTAGVADILTELIRGKRMKLIRIGFDADRVFRDIVSRDRKLANLRTLTVGHVETALAFAVVRVIAHTSVEPVRGLAEDNGVIPDASDNVSLAAKTGHICAEGICIIGDPEKDIVFRYVRAEALGEPLRGFFR